MPGSGGGRFRFQPSQWTCLTSSKSPELSGTVSEGQQLLLWRADVRIKQILLRISAQHNAWFMLSPNPQGLLLRTVLSTCYIVKREKNSCKSNPIGVWQGVGGSSKHTVLLYKENIIESVIFFSLLRSQFLISIAPASKPKVQWGQKSQNIF